MAEQVTSGGGRSVDKSTLHPFFHTIPIYLSRYTPGVKGDQVMWAIGEKAVWVNAAGKRHNVTIKSEPCTHAQAPGKVIRECAFDDEGGVLNAVDAAGLEPLHGWPTLPPNFFAPTDSASVETRESGT